ncbi:MAG: hypothetical protein R3A44_07540 [Caldilineaceae bacterium]
MTNNFDFKPKHLGLTYAEQFKEQAVVDAYMETWDFNLPWYHGSQQPLSILRIGSSITQDYDIARVFSHRPALFSFEDDGSFKHNGNANGYLYVIDEPIHAADVYPHPHPINKEKWEWLTKRELKVHLLEHTAVRAAERLSDDDVADIWRRQRTADIDSLTLESFRDDG